MYLIHATFGKSQEPTNLRPLYDDKDNNNDNDELTCAVHAEGFRGHGPNIVSHNNHGDRHVV